MQVVARLLYGSGDAGLTGGMVSKATRELDESAGVFRNVVQVEGNAGDVCLTHPFLLHARYVCSCRIQKTTTDDCSRVLVDRRSSKINAEFQVYLCALLVCFVLIPKDVCYVLYVMYVMLSMLCIYEPTCEV
jgi:hypothetical protein